MDNKKAPSPFAVLWGWASGEHGGYYASVALAVLGVACGMVPYFCVAAMIGLLLEGGGLAECLPWCGLALAGYAGKALFSTWSTSLSHTATYHTLRRVRQNLLSKLSRVPMGTILDTPSGQYKTTIVDRVEGMEPTLAHLLPEMTSNLLVPVSIAVYIFVLDWRMGLASLVTTGIGFTVASQSGKTYADRWQGAVEVGRCMANAIVEYVGGIQVVKAFSQSAGSYKRYSDAVTENAQYYVDWMADNQKYMAIMQAVIPSVLLPVLPVGLLLWGDGSLSTAVFLTIVVLSLGLTGPLVSAMTFVDELAVVGTNVGEISAILEAPELERPAAEMKLNGLGIRMDHVSFAYRQEDGEVLHDVNLDIQPGTVTALVGPSGSGKSTIAKLIAGFWDVTGGSVALGGVNLRKIPLEQLNRQIAYVSQDNYLFDRTVRDNIRMGRLNATDAEVEAVAKAAGCDDFIRQLAQGYDTICGGGGGHLSGGEKQRISIARAMLKDAPIVILDEATASIDPENEAVIQQAISRLTEGKTLIVIAHRLGTVAGAGGIAGLLPAVPANVAVLSGRAGRRGGIRDVQRTSENFRFCRQPQRSFKKIYARGFPGSCVHRVPVLGLDADLGDPGGRRELEHMAGDRRHAGLCGRTDRLLLLVHQCGDRDRLFHGGGKEDSYRRPAALYPHGLLQ